MGYYKSLLIDSHMIKLHFSIKKLRVGKTMGVLHLFPLPLITNRSYKVLLSDIKDLFD